MQSGVPVLPCKEMLVSDWTVQMELKKKKEKKLIMISANSTCDYINLAVKTSP